MIDEAPHSRAIHRPLSGPAGALALTEYECSGPPLVLVHGIGNRHVSWWPVIDGLTSYFRVYALDLRGHGDSAKPASGYAIDDYVTDLTAALDALQLDRPLVMGHSLGALITLSWGAAHPGRAAGLVLNDPPLRTRASGRAALTEWAALAAGPPATAAAYYHARNPHWTESEITRRADSITRTAPGVYAGALARWESILAEGDDVPTPLSAELPPTLLVGGDVDLGGLVTANDVAHFRATVPRGEVVILPGTSHQVHRDDPAAFLAAVVPFLLAAAATPPE